jgi:ferredoxin
MTALSEYENGIIISGDMPTTVTIELDGKSHETTHHPGTTILQTARSIGLSPPSSCEAGNCATCMAQIVNGSVEMLVNDVLTDQDLADGYVLTCQSIPTSDAVRLTYDI